MLATSLALALMGMTPTKIDIVVRDLKDGDALTGIRKLRVTVNSDQPVNQVEFYVGDNLRSNDTSTPYEFEIDPLNESEGNLKLTFAAYTAQGDNAKKTYTVKIDTGVSKGADKNIEEGYTAMAKSQFDQAIYSGRVALKAKAGYNPARVLLARAFLSKGVFDKAQAFAEDALASDPNMDEANEVLSGISLRKALETFLSSGQKRDVEPIRAALERGVSYRRKGLIRQFEAIGAPTDQNLIQYAKLALRAGRNNAAIQALSPQYRKDAKQTEIANLLAFAQIRDADNAGATLTLSYLEKAQAMDAYSYGLKSILLVQAGKDGDADAAMSEAIGNDPDALGVKLAQTAIALKRNRTGALSNLVASLSKDESPRPEVNYYLSILLNQMQSFVDADKRFMTAILAEPSSVDLLIERGNQSVLMMTSGTTKDAEQLKYQAQIAGAYFNAALTSQPDSPQALTAMVLYYTSTGDSAKALSYADGAVKAGPGYAAAHYAASMVYTANAINNEREVARMRKEAKTTLSAEELKKIGIYENQARELTKKSAEALKKSIALDTYGLDGRPVPSLNEAFTYFARHGRIPYLVGP
ncbi:MAG: Ig-like domain-containing protein [Fimbriimonadaceae bacterium]